MYLPINFEVFFVAPFNYYRTFAVHFLYLRRGYLPISVAGIFMSAYDHSIWRFRTPV